MAEKPLYEKKVGFTYRIYPNRIEIERPSLVGKQIEIILIRSITNVETRGINAQIYITTQDGQEHKIAGIAAGEAQKMRSVILSLL